ncbi:substrate-binding periplasmic protein [Marinimicrobium agarilyticum]|uniref:substrate-binding periplasmic protein n=1 Tax=Marinimicrobium agarilyticum TaxID=306546 RepID=UPI0003FEA298|nr:transporter substrate-binding domain-containing protein [Marinimicrobium agarilyticum]
MLSLFSVCKRVPAPGLKALSAVTLTLLLGGTGLCASAQTVLRVNQTDHPLDAYAVGALRVALEYMEGDYQVEVADDPITQTRAIERLETDQMDVMWLSSNREVEERLLPIRFPLLKGLLGYRIFIINPERQARFDQVESFEDLKQLTFGQGAGWPDIKVLESNGLEVITTSKYDNLFYMVEGGRFDAFPRGVLEPWTELEAHPDLPLTVEENLVLVYKLPFYLFVSRDKPELAQAIQEGLDQALASGRFDEYFYGTDMIEDALTRSNLKNRQPFPLENPSLSEETPLERDDYWLTLDDL